MPCSTSGRQDAIFEICGPPDGFFVSTGSCNLEVSGSNPGRAGYLSSWLCINSAPILYNKYIIIIVHNIVHYKEPLKPFEIRKRHRPGFGFFSVAILPQCAESDVKQYSLTRILCLEGSVISFIPPSSGGSPSPI